MTVLLNNNNICQFTPPSPIPKTRGTAIYEGVQQYTQPTSPLMSLILADYKSIIPTDSKERLGNLLNIAPICRKTCCHLAVKTSLSSNHNLPFSL